MNIDYVWALAKRFGQFVEAVMEAGRKSGEVLAVEAVFASPSTP